WQGCALPAELFPHQLKAGILVVAHLMSSTQFFIQRKNCIILEFSLGQGGEWAWVGAVQDTAARSSHSIPRSCNAAMRHRKRAIHSVAWLTQRVKA
ncbi:MAG: hypothetical protein RPU42_11875, partial [Candidatus Sedimenticola sp. (ex Thyasira tokunagai)]